VTEGPTKTGVVVPFGLPRPVALELIRKLFADGAFAMAPKARANVLDRNFTMRQVLTTLAEGSINQGPTRDECNDWRCRLKKRVAGRLVHVVIAIHDMSYLNVISVH
jgi:hypothetical protein